MQDTPFLANASKVDAVNIVLLLIAFVLAFSLPFHLFLFAYAVLGPLHYLTEIVWLREKRFFIAPDTDPHFFLWSAAIASLMVVFFIEWSEFFPALVYFLFGTALGITLIPVGRWRTYYFFALITTTAFFAFFPLPWHSLIFALLIPTLIHVFLFTLIFMLVGALRSASRLGLIAAALFLLFGFALFFIDTSRPLPTPGSYIFESYQPFLILNETLLRLVQPVTDELLTFASFGAGLMQFIAFAYTYHYLNWFSKVRIIRWGSASQPRLIVIAMLWLAAVGLYAYDYRVGIQALLLLSFLHVVLEFPLNHRSFADLFGQLRMRLSRPA